MWVQIPYQISNGIFKAIMEVVNGVLYQNSHGFQRPLYKSRKTIPFLGTVETSAWQKKLPMKYFIFYCLTNHTPFHCPAFTVDLAIRTNIGCLSNKNTREIVVSFTGLCEVYDLRIQDTNLYGPIHKRKLTVQFGKPNIRINRGICITL